MTSCGARGGREMVAALEAGISERGLDWRVEKVHAWGNAISDRHCAFFRTAPI